MDIKTLAKILLIGHVVSASFMFFVLKKQLALFKLNIEPELVKFRKVLFGLSLAVFLGNFIPIVIDVLTIVSKVTRSQPSTIGIYYAFSNCIFSILSAILIWTMYRLASKIAVIVEHDKEVALKKK